MSVATERPGRARYALATKITTQNDPCTENGWVGQAQKQVAPSWSAGLETPFTIKVGERFVIRTKGIHEFSTASGSKGVLIAGAALGTGVYIRPADNTLRTGSTPPAAGDLPFGKVAEIPTQVPGRGVPTGRIRIDLDDKDGLPLA